MFWKRKLRVQVDELASTLFKEFVQTPIDGASGAFDIDTDVTSASGRKLQLYQYASVLLAVLDAERRDRAFSPVRECLKRRFLPPSFAQEAETVEQVQHAMEDLSELIQPDGQPCPMSWGNRWFSDVGVQQNNPATLTMFVLRWPARFVTIAKFLRELKPVA